MTSPHQPYTATVRAPPLPPRRTASRNSSIARPPTPSPEQEFSTSVDANSPGHITTPRGDEFNPIPAPLQHASQRKYVDETAHPPPEDSKQPVSPTTRRSNKVLSNQPAAQPTPRQKPQELTELEFDNSSSLLSSYRSSVPDTNAKAHLAKERPAEGGYTISPKSNMAVIVPEVENSANSSPSLNCKVSAAVMVTENENVDVVSMQSIKISISHHTQMPVNHHSTPAAAVAASGTRSAARQSTASRYIHSKESGEHDDDEPRKAKNTYRSPQKYQRQQPKTRDGSAAEATVHPEAPAANDAGSNGRGDGPSHAYSRGEPSSRCDKHSVCSPPVRSVDPHNPSPRSNNSETLSSSPEAVYLHPTDEHTQHRMKEPRTSKPRAESKNASHRSMELSSERMAVVPVETTPWYSTRPSRNDKDPLDMNTPNAERVCLTSALTLHRSRSESVPAAALEGTELLPGMPQLQGHNDDNVDRPYRTMVRFIARQPEEERPGLEEMLANYAGHENTLCGALGGAYSDDFEVLKTICSRTPEVPLLADRPPVDKSTTAS
ncbi:hypothetical protein NXY56_003413 [Leishmania guyanensis]|uniref:Uncharacterized protein n=1 Tax=Leishmania guyanensis TaxID=5670 RepID=A0A1E1J5Y8_LEIGU|nr:hypothetical protein, conserved [Leishmania guyanensis]